MIRPEEFRGDSSELPVIHEKTGSPYSIVVSSLEISWVRLERLSGNDMPGGFYWCSSLCGEVYWQPSPEEGATLVGTNQILENNGETVTITYVPLGKHPEQ